MDNDRVDVLDYTDSMKKNLMVMEILGLWSTPSWPATPLWLWVFVFARAYAVYQINQFKIIPIWLDWVYKNHFRDNAN